MIQFLPPKMHFNLRIWVNPNCCFRCRTDSRTVDSPLASQQLGSNPPINPPCRVPLLARRPPVSFQNRDDHRQGGRKLGPLFLRLLPACGQGVREPVPFGQDLRHRQFRLHNILHLMENSRHSLRCTPFGQFVPPGEISRPRRINLCVSKATNSLP